jgi:hypothetical protein
MKFLTKNVRQCLARTGSVDWTSPFRQPNRPYCKYIFGVSRGVGFPEGTALLDGCFVASLFAPMPDIDKDRPIQPSWSSISWQVSVSACRCCCPLFVSLDAARIRVRTIPITAPQLGHNIATGDSPQAPASDNDNISLAVQLSSRAVFQPPRQIRLSSHFGLESRMKPWASWMTILGSCFALR